MGDLDADMDFLSTQMRSTSRGSEMNSELGGGGV